MRSVNENIRIKTQIPAGTISLSAYTIGQEFGGGIIFYIDSTKQHGLIAAKEDITSSYTDAWTGIQFISQFRWSTGQFTLQNDTDYAFRKVYTSTAFGQGASNTDKILAKYPPWIYPNTAAAVARAYRGGGYSDWFLPSKDELHQLDLQKSVVGGLDGDLYWSSSEDGSEHAWYESFPAGHPMSYYKWSYSRVRPVRAF
ncbi:MAG: DUF1566 domain-containing protein [Chlorobium sp.]|nr:MAG: DUF1566 domain-containing protein [Chlorobium sp.]